MWNSGAKICCITVGERNASGGSLQRVEFAYLIFWIHHSEHALVA